MSPSAGAQEPSEADLDAILGSLTLEAKVGQLLMVGVPGMEMAAEGKDLLAALEPGGIILLGRNVKDAVQLARFTGQLQEPWTGSYRTGAPLGGESAAIPRFIAIDQEGGTVVRIPRGATVFPGAMATGATGSTALAWIEGKVAGSELAAVGVNMNLAPVLDVNSNRKNPVIGVRAYGDDPALVAGMGTAYGRGLQEAGVSAVAKHFPGHGDASLDSHESLPRLPHDLARLEKVELVPFAAAAKAGVDCVMAAHLVFPKIDKAPASMSRVLLTEILRGQLAFDGVALTDDLEMKAVSGSDGLAGIGPAAVKAVAAGADMVMVIWRRESKDAARSALLAAIQSGALPTARVDEAVRRILAIKARRGLFGDRP